MAQIAGFVSEFALARYDTFGNPGGSFGASGKQTSAFAGFGDFGSGVGIQSDGKIVVCGTVTNANFTTDYGLDRYDTKGNLDAAFGLGGKVTTDFSNNDEASSISIRPSDGKIIVAGVVTGAPVICSCPDLESFVMTRMAISIRPSVPAEELPPTSSTSVIMRTTLSSRATAKLSSRVGSIRTRAT